MVLTSLEGLSDTQKEELVASLACLLIGDNELSAEKLSAVATASGNSISDAMAALFVSVVSKAPKGIEAFAPPPGGAGG
jgi:ribosomal protein L12E/L44/L45/RPP1/RPP2